MQSLRTYGTITVVAFGVLLAVSALAMAGDRSLVRYVQHLKAGGEVDDARAEAIDNRQTVLGFAQIGMTIACAIPLLLWFHRAHKNLAAAGLHRLRYSPGWAV